MSAAAPDGDWFVVIEARDAKVVCRAADGSLHTVPKDHVWGPGEPPSRCEVWEGVVIDGETVLVERRDVAQRWDIIDGRGKPLRVVVRNADRGGETTELDSESLGLTAQETQEDVHLLRRYDVGFLRAVDDTDTTFWILDHASAEGMQSLVKQVRKRRAEERVREQREMEQRRLRQRPPAEWAASFINPYTFVPFPDGDDAVDRSAPAGHAQLTGYSGTIRWTWKARTPLLVRSADAERFPRRPAADGKGTPFIPGSSIKGALRSLHETLAGGCLRVLQGDYLPVYRDPAVMRRGDWRIARVVEARDGEPSTLKVSARTVWVNATDLSRRLGEPLKTGQEMRVDDARRTWVNARNGAPRQRFEAPAEAVSADSGPENRWRLLLTDGSDGGARNPDHPYYAALGSFHDATSVTVDHSVLQRYQREAAGTRDVQLLNRGDQPDVKVSHNGVELGGRQPVREQLEAGDIVWVHVEGGPQQDATLRVTRITRAVLWRHEGTTPMGQRVPEALLPCTDPTDLCPSCQLFGSADVSGRAGDAAAEQRAYRGHVRFGDALALDPTIEPVCICIAPLRAPRPGAGQMYLEHPPGRQDAASSREQRPIREWGSKGDEPTPRRLRGRKHYWHGDPSEQQQPRHHGDDAQVKVAAAGSKFAGWLAFDGLTEVQLGGLIAVLEPQRVLEAHRPAGFADPPGPIAGRVGGGKPLGFGTVEVTGLEVEADHADSRYRAAPRPDLDPDALLAAFVAAVPEPVRDTWTDLAAVLHVGHVPDDYISYPRQHPWGKRVADPFEPAFGRYAFWSMSKGGYHREHLDQFRPLPRARDLDQALPIDYSEGPQ